jgi:hypothetical protein
MPGNCGRGPGIWSLTDDEYQNQGLRLTLRQLYYQLVTRNAITNEEKSYKNLMVIEAGIKQGGQ